MGRPVWFHRSFSRCPLAAVLVLSCLVMHVRSASAIKLNSGDIIVVDPAAVNVVRINPLTGAQTLISKGTFLSAPGSVALPSKTRILVADSRACQWGGIIQVGTIVGAQSTVACGQLTQSAQGMAIEPSGNILISGVRGIARIHPATGAGSLVYRDTGNVALSGIVLDSNGQILATAQRGFGGPCPAGCGAVLRIDPTTGNQSIVSSGGSFSQVNNNLQGIAIEPSGNILVIDSGTKSIIRVDPSTGNQTLVSSGAAVPIGIAVAPSSDIFLVGIGGVGGPGQVLRVNPMNGDQTVLSSGDLLLNPFGIALVP